MHGIAPFLRSWPEIARVAVVGALLGVASLGIYAGILKALSSSPLRQPVSKPFFLMSAPALSLGERFFGQAPIPIFAGLVCYWAALGAALALVLRGLRKPGQPGAVKALRLLAGSVLVLCSSTAWAGETIEVRTSLSDVFRVSETKRWSVRLEREVVLRSADVRVGDKQGFPFSLMLYFKADTPDLAQFDTPEKMARSVRVSSEEYLSGAVEKSITVKQVPVTSTYGFYAVLTDAEVAKKSRPAPREFKYLTRGMVRLSKDSALGFSLMTHDVGSNDYRTLLDYVSIFVKPSAKN